MSARPTPRKSSLAGSSPIVPPNAPQPTLNVVEPAAQPPAPAPDPTPSHPEAAQPAPATEDLRPTASTRAKSKYPPKVSFYQDPEDTARVRGAILHTMTTEGSRTLSQFIHKAVMAEVERLEAKYNGGQPFPAVGTRELPQGRPMGQ